VKSFSYQGIDYSINQPKNTYSALFKKLITDIQYNRTEDPFGWRYKVSADNY